MLGSDAFGEEKEKQWSQIVVFSEEFVPLFKALNGEVHLGYYSVPQATTYWEFIVIFFFFFVLLCEFIVATYKFLFSIFLTEINDLGSLKI